MALLKQVLGDAFLRPSNVLMIEGGKLTELERKIVELLSPKEAGTLLAELRRLRYRPFTDLLMRYPEGLSKTAAKLGKSIYPVEISAVDIQVALERLRPFGQSLVHVFNNMLDHGIEESEERTLSGKDPLGRITCALTRGLDALRLIVADDGRGIDADAIRKRAISIGIYTEESAAKASNEEILQCIFLDGFSTRDEVTGLSGRGVGLSAVKRETERIGGTVQISTKPGKGTAFIFDLPMSE